MNPARPSLMLNPLLQTLHLSSVSGSKLLCSFLYPTIEESNFSVVLTGAQGLIVLAGLCTTKFSNSALKESVETHLPNLQQLTIVKNSLYSW